jgi:hypothetical protein
MVESRDISVLFCLILLCTSSLPCRCEDKRSTNEGSGTKVKPASRPIETIGNASLKTAVLRQTPETELRIDDIRSVTLIKGELLVSAFEPTTVQAERYSLIVPKGTIALISNRSRVVKVHNLYEEQRSSLNLRISKKLMPIGSGEEMIVAPDNASMQKAIVYDQVCRRDVCLFDLSCGGLLACSEFWPLHVMKQSKVLRGLVHSQKREDKVLVSKILKMAACLAHTTRGHGTYAWITE